MIIIDNLDTLPIKIMNTIPQLENDVLMTIEEVMAMLKISKPTAYRYVTAKKFTSYKIGGSLRISKQSILEYLNAHQV